MAGGSPRARVSGVLIRADARWIPLRDRCVDCVVTSPPYWGLRDYGHADQIGLEATPDAYVANLVRVFRDVRRVLKEDGTLWLNLGDSYAGSASSGGPSVKQCSNRGSWHDSKRPLPEECKRKDLIGIPWRVAFALQSDGWYLRSDIIWSKPNPMPESVTDRPTKAHEYLFLLAKSEKYWYDAPAIAEPVSAAMVQQMQEGYEGLGLKDYEAAGVQNPSSVKARIIENARRKSAHMEGTPRNDGDRWRTVDRGVAPRGLGRNRRSVWTVTTQPYEGAHFATMPEALVEPCILAGCRMGGMVLDPFVGSGTVVAVAQRLGRRGIGIDLTYQELARERTAQRGIVFEAENAG